MMEYARIEFDIRRVRLKTIQNMSKGIFAGIEIRETHVNSNGITKSDLRVLISKVYNYLLHEHCKSKLFI